MNFRSLSTRDRRMLLSRLRLKKLFALPPKRREIFNVSVSFKKRQTTVRVRLTSLEPSVPVSNMIKRPVSKSRLIEKKLRE